MIVIDGSLGEGGGQMLRTSLSLSAITGKAFQLKNIRANRKKPGLMRQHLTCVEAVAKICQAETKGANLGSQNLLFIPKAICSGDFEFSIGTAGSTMLIVQTILYPLLYADKPSTFVVKGGTHNEMAPPFEFIQDSFLPIVKKMGVHLDLELNSAGFYPAGGGSVFAKVYPIESWQTLSLLQKGALIDEIIMGIISGLPVTVVDREVAVIRLKTKKRFDQVELREFKSLSSGNLVCIKEVCENVSNVFTGFGRRGVKAESVAEEVSNEFLHFAQQKAPVSEYLSDQLLLPLALAGKGEMNIACQSMHFKTNISVIKEFLEVTIEVSAHDAGGFIVRIVN